MQHLQKNYSCWGAYQKYYFLYSVCITILIPWSKNEPFLIYQAISKGGSKVLDAEH